VNHWALTACFAFSGFVVVACNTVSATNITVIPNTPSMIPKTTITPVPSIMVKISPTITETPFPPIQVTQTFQPEILAEVATLDAIVSEKPELRDFYDRFCITHGNCAYVSGLGLSPNKKWAVFFTTEKGTGGLSIINVNKKNLWTISYRDITGFDSEYGCDCTVAIEHWSHDGRYLYVSPRIASSGGEEWFWRSEIQLIRINLDNGTWVNTKMGSSFSFSPNDEFIAFRREKNLMIHEFQTGEERIFTLPIDYTVLGRFTWSSDSKQIIFVCSSMDELLSDDLPQKPSGFTLFLLNMDSMQVQTILEKDERYLYPIEWLTPNSVLLGSLYKVTSDGNHLESNNEQYELDLETNSISKYGSP
jgi:hypothetical protein